MNCLHTGIAFPQPQVFFAAVLNLRTAGQESNFFPQQVKHVGKHVESFLLVFVQRILLTVGAQNDGVTHVIQRGDMLFPQLIHHLQQNILFYQTHQFFRHSAVFLDNILLNHFNDFAAHGFGVHLRFFRPFVNRQHKTGHPPDFLLQLV